ncbi:MAG TPA: acyltransferase [Candidatus Acidoferrales bacterium]|nr:acyltransferase [Candidatus Acidoferrales bacterium]
MSQERVVTAAEPETPRVVGLDVARGLLIAYVVIVIHGSFWLRIVPAPENSLLLFEMPLIFMISGAAYAYAPKPAQSVRSYLFYVLSRGVRILVPFWAYTFVCSLIAIFARHMAPLETIVAWLDPFRGGADHMYMMLSLHLWFVPPFLAVMALMPLLTRLPVWRMAPLWVWAAGGALVVFAVDALGATATALDRQTVFYTLWALFGFGLGKSAARFGVRDYAIVLTGTLMVLASALLLFPTHTTADMQANKFPPNALFFLFSAAWVSVFMIAVRGLDARRIEALARSRLLKPFIKSGYSIYLWQGLGYTIASLVGRQYGWNVLVVWIVAIALTVGLGSAAAPLERLRVRARPRRV